MCLEVSFIGVATALVSGVVFTKLGLNLKLKITLVPSENMKTTLVWSENMKTSLVWSEKLKTTLVSSVY